MNRSAVICEHFHYTRDELTVLIAARQVRSVRGILARFGQGAGCATCLSTIEQILKELRTSEQLRHAAWASTERVMRVDEAAEAEVTVTDARVRSISDFLHHRYARIRQMYSLQMVVTDNVSASSPAQWADVGVIVRPDEYQVYLCGQGGDCPRSGFLLAMCRTQEQLVRCLDRFLMYYILTADPYTRTAPWIDMLANGTQHLRRVIVVDTLRVGVELDDMFQTVAGAGSLAAGFDPQSCDSMEEVAHVHFEHPPETVISF